MRPRGGLSRAAAAAVGWLLKSLSNTKQVNEGSLPNSKAVTTSCICCYAPKPNSTAHLRQSAGCVRHATHACGSQALGHARPGDKRGGANPGIRLALLASRTGNQPRLQPTNNQPQMGVQCKLQAATNHWQCTTFCVQGLAIHPPATAYNAHKRWMILHG
jgi:hypothetical protein